jgi:hypothetical protein
MCLPNLPIPYIPDDDRYIIRIEARTDDEFHYFIIYNEIAVIHEMKYDRVKFEFMGMVARYYPEKEIVCKQSFPTLVDSLRYVEEAIIKHHLF